MESTSEEMARRGEVIARLLDFIRQDRRILLPAFDGVPGQVEFALQTLPENDFSGTVAEFKYQFEGEDDLLHLIVCRRDGSPLSVEQARKVVAFLLPEISPSVIWLRPGEGSQHFYLGHDELLP